VSASSRKRPSDAREAPSEWERQPGETDAAWRAFGVYRDLGLTRSLEKLCRALGHRSNTTVKNWCRRHRWVDRCRAFDDHCDAIELAAAEEERRRLAVRHARARVRLQSDFLDRVTDPERGAARDLYDIATCADLHATTDEGGKLQLSGLTKDSARVSAWKLILDRAAIAPAVGGDDHQDLDADTRRRIVEDELASILGALPDHDALMLAGLLRKGWSILDGAGDGH
jgi:hypothetical protein